MSSVEFESGFHGSVFFDEIVSITVIRSVRFFTYSWLTLRRMPCFLPSMTHHVQDTRGLNWELKFVWCSGGFPSTESAEPATRRKTIGVMKSHQKPIAKNRKGIFNLEALTLICKTGRVAFHQCGPGTLGAAEAMLPCWWWEGLSLRSSCRDESSDKRSWWWKMII